MGREVKRVPLDFDWPMGQVWPGFMGVVCSKDIQYCIGDKNASLDTCCAACRHAGRLAGTLATPDSCPEWQIQPPKGEGWQMWETTSEGSAISPVFATPEELARWLADNNASAFGGSGATHEQWLGMIKSGWAPSAVADNKGLRSGVEYVAEATDPKEGEAK